MLSAILLSLLGVSAASLPPAKRESVVDTLTVSGICWDVSTGVDLRARITAVVKDKNLQVGESDAMGRFTIQLPDSTQSLSFEVPGYPTTTVPVTIHGKPDKKARFTIGVPMINPDSQQVARVYQPITKPADQRALNKPVKGAKRVLFQIRNARAFWRLPATVCLTNVETGRTNCFPVDSTKIPSFVWLKPGEKLTVDVQAPGYQPYRGKLVVGQSEKEELHQIKLLQPNNVLAVSYDISEPQKLQYEVRNAQNQVYMSHFDVPLPFFEWNHFKPGEEYEFIATAPDGQRVVKESFTMVPGFNFKVVRRINPESIAVRASTETPERINPSLFDSTVLYFDQSNYLLRSDVKRKLDSISWLLISRRNLVAQLTGHTDNVGNRALNLTLSEYRTRAVAAYLHQKGVQLQQLSPTWKGPDAPAAPNNTEENKTKNRRVVVRLLAE